MQQADNHLHKLLQVQRDFELILKILTVTKQLYIAFAYSEEQPSDIKKFCCKLTEARVFAVDITFNVCVLWITKTSYRSKRLVIITDGGTSDCVGPTMVLFAKYKKTLGRFGLEILSENSNLKSISFTDFNLESAIFTGLKIMIPVLRRLTRHRYSMKQNNLELAGPLSKIGQNIADRKLSLSEIITDIYISTVSNFYEYGIVEAMDTENFNTKLDTLEDQ